MNELIKTRTKNIPYDRVRELNKIMNCWLKYILIHSREVSVWNEWESEIMFNQFSEYFRTSSNIFPKHSSNNVYSQGSFFTLITIKEAEMNN